MDVLLWYDLGIVRLCFDVVMRFCESTRHIVKNSAQIQKATYVAFRDPESRVEMVHV